MRVLELGAETETYLEILTGRFNQETGDEITVAEMLDSVVKLIFQEIYENVIPEVGDDGEIYFGVIIPSGSKKGAEYILERINKELGYGGWVREGNYNDD